jgi:hypothetical protein
MHQRCAGSGSASASQHWDQYWDLHSRSGVSTGSTGAPLMTHQGTTLGDAPVPAAIGARTDELWLALLGRTVGPRFGIGARCSTWSGTGDAPGSRLGRELGLAPGDPHLISAEQQIERYSVFSLEHG